MPRAVEHREGPRTELIDLLLSATNDGVIDWDIAANTARYSTRWKMLLGYEDHELPSTPDAWKTLTHPADLPTVEALLQESLENLWPFVHKWRMRHRNEEWRWFLCRSALMREPDGQPARMVSVFTDVTDQVRAEERYRALLHGVPDTIFRIRTDGFILDEKPGNLASPLVNSVGAGTLTARAIDHDWAQATLAAVSLASQTGQVVAFEQGDGDARRCVETRVVKSGDEEAVCIVRDVTARKQAERRLVDSLERLNKTQRELMKASHLAGMAEVASSVLHNVGNVLNSVNVSASTATEVLEASPIDEIAKAVGLLPDRQYLIPFLTEDHRGKRLIPFLRKAIKVVVRERDRIRVELESLQRNVDHVKMIVATQQTQARVQGGLIERVAPGELIEDALRLTSNWDGRDGVQLVREYQPLPEVFTERHRVVQILINLFTNARQAVSEAAERRVVVRLAPSEDDRFTISVADSGRGIAPDNITKIFNYGFTTRKDGHGFGLHGSALAAAALGGSLIAQSAGPGQGALFVLELPQRTAPAA